MGVREFESAETAENRRIQRGTRRRYNRRIKRIQLLQQTISSLFQDDLGFFIETEEKEKHFWRNSNQFESNSLSETLRRLGMNTRKYPTIYHLRHDLITAEQKFHPRLIYLALHHLVKYRGHFLNENMNWNDDQKSDSTTDLLQEYFTLLSDHSYELKELETIDFKKIISIIEEEQLTNADKRKEILKVTGKEFHQPITLLLGLIADIAKLFPASDQQDMYIEEKLKLSFSYEDITETYEKLADEEKIVIDLAHTIYQSVLLKDLLGNASYVSQAKVQSFNQFAEDLQIVKKIYNDYFGEKEYRNMFITSRKNQTEFNQTKEPKLLCEFDRFLKMKKAYEEKFYRDLTNKMEGLLKKSELKSTDKALIEEIVDRLERNQFLQKQKNQMNAAIPHQNNVFEAEMILRNQQSFYPEITDDMIEKIKQIISFRIPYYIGPLVKDNENAKFGWVSRKSTEEPVLPWTLDEVVDRSQSAENFIYRMTSYCSYLTNEKVLPKHSLLYQEFEVLNELNGIQIRKSSELSDRKFRLNTDEKEWIMNNVFKKYKNVTHRILKRELKNSPYKHLILDEEAENLKEIFGTQQEDRFGTSLSSYIDLKRVFGTIDDEKRGMIEELIYWITVFEEKDIIRLKIREKYPSITEKQANQLVHFQYAGWGRLSKMLLDELPADTGTNQTIIEIMRENTIVFMEMLSVEKYDLQERIAKINFQDTDTYKKISYQDIEELQGSPALKKGIWQAMLIVEELTGIFGEPENIMIEFAREDGIKGRTEVNKKKQLSDLQKAINKEEIELKSFLKEHIQYEETRYKDKRLYLYIIQQGKCLYSGNQLHLSRLQDYEVDHILPRSFVKDDSMDNLALVTKEMNQRKGNEKMPLEILSANEKVSRKLFWKKLFENKLISQRKYQRLMKETFSAQDKESFFARQLVETRQITKHVKDLLNERFEKTEIHTVNANIVTGLREHSNTFKIRNLNNKHHAVDAALTALIIQFIINKYGYNFLNFNFKYQEARKKWREMLSQYKKNFFLFADIDQYDKFTHFQTGELLSGRQFLAMINDEMPWQTTKKLGSAEEAFYDQTLYSPKSIKGKNPRYTSSKLDKGVHSNLKVDSSYMISYKYVDSKGKEKTASDIVNYLVIERNQNKKITGKEKALFLAKKVAKGKVNDAVIHTKILKHQLILFDNDPLFFVSDKEMHNAKQFRPEKEILKRLYNILNRSEVSNEYLQSTFALLVETAIKQFETYLPESRIKALKGYVDDVIDLETFNKGIDELFKMASASAARSAIFGGRYERRLNPKGAKFVYQSATGLNYRKPKSYKNELWST